MSLTSYPGHADIQNFRARFILLFIDKQKGVCKCQPFISFCIALYTFSYYKQIFMNK